MPKIDFPVNPIREKLYSAEELYHTFDVNDEQSLLTTLDFRAYSEFIKNGGAFPDTYYTGMMRSLHDFSIWNCVQDIMNENKLVAIMGGHKLERKRNDTYEKIAQIAFRLSNEGYLLSSGGGPGAMEATHLGAYFSSYNQNDLHTAIDTLSKVPRLPDDLSDIIDEKGQVNKKLASRLFEWLKPAFELCKKYPDGGESVSLPTWLYGHEPSTPFASKIAKYYQNSIREDGLLTIAKYGVIYAEGKAGTLQEIFQDTTQNYYKTVEFFSPMVFLGKEYWSEKYPVKNVLDKLIDPEENKKYILYSDSVDEIIAFLLAFDPEQKKHQ
jgi:predicted Rossmann-fold nucleotide-binding protein